MRKSIGLAAFWVVLSFGSATCENLDNSEMLSRALAERVSMAITFDRGRPSQLSIARESISSEELPEICRMLTSGKFSGDRRIVGLLVAKMRQFDNSKTPYDKETCIDSILSTLESAPSEIDYHQLLLSLREIEDSRLMAYIEERDNLESSAATQTRQELLEKWRKRSVGIVEMPRTERDTQQITTHRTSSDLSSDVSSKIPPDVDLGRWFITGALILIGIGSWMLVRQKRVSR